MSDRTEWRIGGEIYWRCLEFGKRFMWKVHMWNRTKWRGVGEKFSRILFALLPQCTLWDFSVCFGCGNNFFCRSARNRITIWCRRMTNVVVNVWNDGVRWTMKRTKSVLCGRVMITVYFTNAVPALRYYRTKNHVQLHRTVRRIDWRSKIAAHTAN